MYEGEEDNEELLKETINKRKGSIGGVSTSDLNEKISKINMRLK